MTKLITPAEFEDRMRDIVQREDINTALYHVYQLMADTLECNGYEAGVKLFRGMVAIRRRGDGDD